MFAKRRLCDERRIAPAAITVANTRSKMMRAPCAPRLSLEKEQSKAAGRLVGVFHIQQFLREETE
jgi:hypothetical protein